ncbi:MAG: FtsX-like permease family protein [Gammaproteobacteria bacterium]|nr:FtsX-like permease family protein [Gammaproteobacteria bacterium]
MAVVIAAASVSSVGLFADRVRGALHGQAAELLAADQVVISPAPIPEDWQQAATARGLDTARTVTFPSMVSAGERLKLADVKGVSDAYPLRGDLMVSREAFGEATARSEGPEAGTVWLDTRLAAPLEVTPGDRVQVGERTFTVAAILAREPDRGGDLFSLAPRLMMNIADVPATGLIQRGSRVTYRLLVSGSPAAVADFRTWVEPRLGRRASTEGVQDARPEMRMALERAERFLALTALMSVVLAGIAVAVSADRHARRHLDAVAILKAMGATQGRVTTTITVQMVALGLAAGGVGVAIGFVGQWGLVHLLATLLPAALPAPGPWPALGGLLTALITLAGFGLPPILGLRRTPPMRILNRSLVAPPAAGRLIYVSAVAAVVLLALWLIRDVRLVAYALGGMAGAFLLLSLVAAAAVALLIQLRRGGSGSWRFGLAGLSRHPEASVIQVVAFGMAVLVILLLTVVRGELLAVWQERLPPDTPNIFLINVQAEERAAVTAFLRDNGVERAELYPMIRGRLTAIDGRPVTAGDYANARAQRLVDREFNLSWATRPQADNRIVAGRWWTADDSGEAVSSVELGLAELLGIELGDRLTFRIAGQELTTRVTSLRTVEWDSFNVNFFIVMPPGVLEDYPQTFITSFHLPAAEHRVLARLVEHFPSVTVLDVAALMAKVRSVMTHATRAIEFVFGFALVAAFAVFAAAIQSTQDERRRQTAVVRVLGGRKRADPPWVWPWSSPPRGGLAGLLGAAGAEATGWLLARFVFELPYDLQPALWLAGSTLTALVLVSAGWLASRRVVDSPPLLTLRGEQE